MDGGRQKLLGRMVDQAWCQAIIFRTANNLKREWACRGTLVCLQHMFESLICVNGWLA